MALRQGTTLHRHAGNKFAANWYKDFLRPSDSNGGPILI